MHYEKRTFVIGYQGISVHISMSFERHPRGWFRIMDLRTSPFDRALLIDNMTQASQSIASALRSRGINVASNQVLGWLYLLKQEPVPVGIKRQQALPQSQNCPRCNNGLMVASADMYGDYLSCLVCGNTKE